MKYEHIEEDYRLIRESIKQILLISNNGSILDALCMKPNCIQFKYDGIDFQLQARHNENPWGINPI